MKTSASMTHNTYPSHLSSAALAAFTLILATPASQASFHLMQIDEIMGGVEGDTSAQAIELRMRAPGRTSSSPMPEGHSAPPGSLLWMPMGPTP